MGRKGQRYPYRVKFHFEADAAEGKAPKVHSRPAETIADAAYIAEEAQNVGAHASIWFIAPGSSDKDAVLIQHLDAAGPIPDGYRLCLSCGGAFPIDENADDGRTVKPFTTHAPGGRYGRCATEIDSEEIVEAYRMHATLGMSMADMEREARRYHEKVTPVCWAVPVDEVDSAGRRTHKGTHLHDRYTDAVNRQAARETFERLAAKGFHVRLVKCMRNGKNIKVDEHTPPIRGAAPAPVPGEFFTSDGVKARAYHMPTEVAAVLAAGTAKWRAESRVMAAELERILADPASYNDQGAIDPSVLTRRVASLRAL